MFVTQRGLLYAIPAGLLLLWQWRARHGSDSEREKRLLPVWAEYILDPTMPLFHIHTFIALSIVLLVLFFDPACCLIVAPQTRRRCRCPSRDLHLAYHRQDARRINSAMAFRLDPKCWRTQNAIFLVLGF